MVQSNQPEAVVEESPPAQQPPQAKTAVAGMPPDRLCPMTGQQCSGHPDGPGVVCEFPPPVDVHGVKIGPGRLYCHRWIRAVRESGIGA